jgi:cytochrome P450
MLPAGSRVACSAVRMAVIDIATALLALTGALAFHLLFTAIYRLFLSPLAAIPGPKLAALSRWYECYYDIVQPARYTFKIQELHSRYGPIVRISPNEVSFSDPEAVSLVFAPGAGQRRDKSTLFTSGLGVSSSMGGAIGHDLHRRRREPLNPFFSQASVLRHENLIREKVQRMATSWLEQAAASNTIVNVSDMFFALTHDIVMSYCFGHDLGLLDIHAQAGEMRRNILGVLRGIKVNLQFPWIRDTMRRLPRAIAAQMAPPGVKDMMRFMANIRREVDAVLSQPQGSSDSDGKSTNIFEELRDTPLLPPAEKTAQRLVDEGTLMIMAGTTSPALSLTLATYHLLANPTLLAKMRAELKGNELASLVELERLPYLNGVATEAHRLTFGLTGRNSRVSPDMPVFYTDKNDGKTYIIPAGIDMSASTSLIHTDETIFPSADAFDPTRWIGADGQERRRYLLSFGKGSRQCIGMNLANGLTALALQELARWNLELFETKEDDVKFLHDYHVATPRLDSPGVRVRVIGRRQR